MPEELRQIANNRRARHDYTIEETFEAGLVLLGSEVKSLRDGRITFKDSFVFLRNGEAWWSGAHIGAFAFAHQFGHEPERDRKLLLHRQELQRLFGKIREKGLTLIPLRLILKNRRIKLEIGLARGKKLHDRREDIKAREASRELARVARMRR